MFVCVCVCSHGEEYCVEKVYGCVCVCRERNENYVTAPQVVDGVLLGYGIRWIITESLKLENIYVKQR